MPATLPKNAKIDRSYKLRTSDPSGQLLTAWDTDSKEQGLCPNQSLPHVEVNAKEKLLIAVQGPPATTITVAVSIFGAIGAVNQVPQIHLELLGGHATAASRLIQVNWTPTAWDVEWWLFQFQGRLCQSWWLYANTFGANAAFSANMAFRLLIARGTALRPTTQDLGEGVVLAP